jgi:hypothetical protein
MRVQRRGRSDQRRGVPRGQEPRPKASAALQLSLVACPESRDRASMVGRGPSRSKRVERRVANDGDLGRTLASAGPRSLAGLAALATLVTTILLAGNAANAAPDGSEFQTTRTAKLSILDYLVSTAPMEHDCISAAQSVVSVRNCVLPASASRLLPVWAEPDEATRGALAGKLSQYKGLLLGFLVSLTSIERDERSCIQEATHLDDIQVCEGDGIRKTISAGSLGGSAMHYVLLQ